MINSGARILSIHRSLLRFALAGIQVFAWIFLFDLYYVIGGNLARALAQTAFLYALSQIVTVLATPYAARMLRNGARRALLYAVCLATAAFLVLGVAFAGTYTVACIIAFALLLGLYRAFYWAPYEIESVTLGRASRAPWSEALIALSPVLFGYLIALDVLSPVYLLDIAALIIALSALPILFLRDTVEDFSWGYRETFRELLAPQNREMSRIAFLEGFAGAALLLFWPLAIFLIVAWSYAVLGLVLSVTFLIAIIAREPVRILLRRIEKGTSPLLTATLAATPWLFRLTIAGPIGAIATDTYFYTTARRRLSLDAPVFQQSADGGSLIDEYTALKEIALGIGRAVACIVGAIVALAFSVPVAIAAVFILASACSAISAVRRIRR